MEEQIVRTVAACPHSVSIARNAKGDASFEVKCYGETPEEAAAKALEIAARLRVELAVSA